MKILALETATMTGSIAILADDTLIAEVRINIRVAHAERLISSIDWLLKNSRVSLEEMDAFAVSIGPGSFTGLRIGLSTVKGLSYATGRPIVPVPTLDALAKTLPFCSYPVCPMLDARKKEVYTGLYKWEGEVFKKIITETAIRPEELLKEIKERTVFVGDGAVIYRRLIEDAVKDKAVFAPPSKMIPSASSVAEIAAERLREGITVDPVSLRPFYIRKSEAEIHWKG